MGNIPKNRITLFVSSVATVFIFGCATTPAELKSRPPALTTSSTKDTKTIAACIGDRLINVENFRFMSSRPTTKGYVVSQEENLGWTGPNSTFSIEILEASQGSLITAYFLGGLGLTSSAEGKIRSAVAGCS